MAPDPYQVLGVARSASADQIRKSFRVLAKAHHPDLNPGDKKAEEAFKRASAAFDILGDPARRKKFDAGEIDADGREVPHGFQSGDFHHQPAGDFAEVDLGEILGQMFGEGGRAGGRRRGFPSRGRDLRARLELDIEQMVKGAKRRVVFSDGKVLDVSVPAGVADGAVLRLKGQGEPGPAGAGDVLVEIAAAAHPVYQRRDDDLVMDLAISVPDAVLGGRLKAPTPEGEVSLRIPKGSNSGSILRLKGRGLAAAGGRRGDLLARLVVTLPETSDAKLERFCEEWRDERPYRARLSAEQNES